MNSPSIAQVVVPSPVDGPFDYIIPDPCRERIAIGKRVWVLFNRRCVVGIIVKLLNETEVPEKKLNTLIKVLDEGEPSFTPSMMQWIKSFGAYYGCSYGEALTICLSPALRKNKAITIEKLQDKQSDQESFSCQLIQDETYRDRWPLILEDIRKTLDQKKSVIVLVPDYAYLPYIKSKLQPIGPVEEWLSKGKVGELITQWTKLRSQYQGIVIGTRSCVFAPVQNLGRIIIFDEENNAFKQEQSPHYHVHRVAQLRMQVEKGKVVFVGSTPSVELVYECQKKGNKVHTFFKEDKAPVQLIDMTNYDPKKSSIISAPLQNMIRQAIDSQRRVLIYMNKRSQQVSLQTPEGKTLQITTLGVERLSRSLGKFFQNVRITSFHKESGQFDQRAQIIIATKAIDRFAQTIQPDMVALIDFDAELSMFDYKASCKAFSLARHWQFLAKEKVIIQTRIRENYVIDCLLKDDTKAFYQNELKIRQQLNYPPFSKLAALHVRGEKEENVKKIAMDIFQELSQLSDKELEISSPFADQRKQFKEQFRYTILLKAVRAELILQVVRPVMIKLRRKRSVKVNLDID